MGAIDTAVWELYQELHTAVWDLRGDTHCLYESSYALHTADVAAGKNTRLYQRHFGFELHIYRDKNRELNSFIWLLQVLRTCSDGQ